MKEINIFDEQLETRKTGDEIMFEGAFDDLLSILIKKHGINEKEITDAVSEILLHLKVKIPKTPDNLTDSEARIEYMLRPSGTMRRRVELKGEWWKDSVDPFFGCTVNGEPVALLPRKTGGYVYRDKNGVNVKINKKTAKNIVEDAFCFYKPFALKKLRLIDLALFMAKNVRIPDFVYVMIISLIVSLLGLASPYVQSQLYGTVIPSGIKSNILAVGFLLAGTAIGATLFDLAQSLVLTRFSILFIRVQNATMMRVLSLPVTFFKDYAAGEVASRMQSLTGLCQTITTTVMSTGLTALFSFVFLFQMQHYAPSMVAPAFLIIFTMLTLSLLSTILQMKISRKRMKASAKLSALLFALISGIQKIKITGAQKRAFAKWAAKYKEIGQLTYSPPMFLRLLEPINLIISLGGGILMYYVAGASGIGTADYLAFMVAYGSMSGAIMMLSGLAHTFTDIKVNLEMVRPIMECEPEIHENKKQLTRLSGNMEMNNLSFRYREDGPLILDNINLKIRSGDYIAIVGKTGSGKSTLLRLLLGFEKPDTGDVYYDGHSLSSLDLRALRQCIGVDLQNGKLMAGSIFANIVITAPWKTLDDAWEAAELAGIAEDIREMPMGMHTVIAEGGSGISGGQRQRLLIARALISKPRLIFFDEATSALDNITQRHVANSIEALKATRVIIAHRLSTIKGCSRVVVLDNGKIVEQGGYDELMEKRGEFYELVKRQTV
ncbi:MAG: NHLP bacteriocin export ABC transporter permease/ATPase subunit [Oscillospiraceae bacterium]|jgi:NHLM bacteriocin system ABC transporter ATP-binding protein|nr:NHLP bacteriocin export ABC transporter permease/ATPase subunit [Oscillospiraceae bacterium]